MDHDERHSMREEARKIRRQRVTDWINDDYDYRPLGLPCPACDSENTSTLWDGKLWCRDCGEVSVIHPRPVNLITYCLKLEHYEKVHKPASES